jgi:DNA-binding protein YbaB
VSERDELLKQLVAVSVDASTADGAVSVTVNTDGVLISLELGDSTRNMPPHELANAIIRTYTSAQRDAALRSGEILVHMGTEGYLMDRYRWRALHQPKLQQAHQDRPDQQRPDQQRREVARPARRPQPEPETEGAVLRDVGW